MGAPSSSSNNRQARKSVTRTVSGHAGSGTKALSAAANCFDRIRKMHGRGATADVYVRSPSNDERTFWFVGKVIRMVDASAGDGNGDGDGDGDGGGASSSKSKSKSLAGTVYPTVSEAVISQKRLIFEYAKSELRPQNLGGAYSNNLELWTAPGDSEMDVVRNKVALIRVVGSTRDIRDGFDVNDVGYNPEVSERDDDDDDDDVLRCTVYFIFVFGVIVIYIYFFAREREREVGGGAFPRSQSLAPRSNHF